MLGENHECQEQSEPVDISYNCDHDLVARAFSEEEEKVLV